MKAQVRVVPEIDNEADLRQRLGQIHQDVEQARSRDELRWYYRHAEALIALTYSPAWEKKFRPEVDNLRRLADDEFATTARTINQRAEKLGTDADHDATWGRRQPGRSSIDQRPTGIPVGRFLRFDRLEVGLTCSWPTIHEPTINQKRSCLCSYQEPVDETNSRNRV